MSGAAERHKASLLQWLNTAVPKGWIDAGEIQALQALESRGAEQLFQAREARPLTVGFFGGTGVGKSSLLNRLAGEAVAAVGVERPTSTEVTVYVHRDYPLEDLEASLPVERVRVLEHGRDAYRNVVWIDMPDIDSVERANRELVFEWLPYIDWLVYVVSPERYRDDVGWRVLKQRGHRHHWLFVMNRWDTGAVDQYTDFARILAGEGFDDSLLFKTSCVAPQADELQRVTAAIDRAVAEHGLAALQAVGERARLGDLRQQCERYAGMLGGEDRWRDFISRGEVVIRHELAALSAYVRDEIGIEAAQAARRASGGEAPVTDAPDPPALVVEHVQDIDAALAVARDGLPAEPLRRRTRPILDSLESRVASAVGDGFRSGAARPGNACQRAAAALMKKLIYALPLTVCLGIAYVVVVRYQEGLTGARAFLGVDFVAHSVMILGLAALIPYLTARLLRPSVRRSIVKRVARALDRMCREVVDEWRAAMNELLECRRAMSLSLAAIRSEIEDDL